MKEKIKKKSLFVSFLFSPSKSLFFFLFFHTEKVKEKEIGKEFAIANSIAFLFSFLSLKKEKGDEKLKEKIGDSVKGTNAKNVVINDEGFTDEEFEQVEKLQKKPKKELTIEEKRLLEECKKKKENRNLIKKSTYVDFFIYYRLFTINSP